MRSFARPFMVLGAMVLFHAPAFAQVDVGQNIQNVPENLNFSDLDLTRGQHLLTIHVPLHARDLHQEIENIEVVCSVYMVDGNVTEYIATGRTSVPYRGRTLDTTVSVPVEFREGEEGFITELEGYRCYTYLQPTNGDPARPESESSDLRFLLDEASTNSVGGSFDQVEMPDLPF